MDIRFGNYKQFVEFFMKAPRNVQKILFSAYPEYAAKLASDYMNTIKKIEPAVKKVADKINPASLPDLRPRITGKETPKISGSKPNPKITGTTPKQIGTYNQSIPNKELDSAFDTLYGKGKQEVPKAKVNTPKGKTSKGLKIGKGGGLLAAAQGLMNLNDPNATGIDKARGATMLGTGALGLASGNPWLLGTAGALAIGDALIDPLSTGIEKVTSRIKYGKPEEWYNQDIGLLDPTRDVSGRQLTPEETQKVIAYNDKINAKIAAQYAGAMKPYAASPEQTPATEQSGQIPNNYTNQVPSQPKTQSGMGIVPQSFQNGQQGGLNNYQDILQAKPIQPVLNSIVEPVNYSNEYLMKANSLSQSLQPQVQGQEQEQMINNDPYNIGDIRGYADVIDSQMAPVPNQPQNIREDVLPEYLQVMEGIRGKQGELNYADILNQYNAAMEADRKQNQLNQMVNAFGAFGQSGKLAPTYYVGANGKLNAIEQDQPAEVNMLPTNTSSNADKFLGQLKIQEAQQKDALAQQKAYQDILKTQQERQDTIDRANAMGEYFNTDPRMFLDTDISKAAMQYIYNPNIQAQANVMEAIGKAPTQDILKAAEQYRDIAGKLDEVQLGKQFDVQIAQLDNQAKILQTQLEQQGLDGRFAAQLASNWKINQFNQMMQTDRALMEDQRARDLAVYGRGTQFGVADRYAARGGSGKQPKTQEEWLKEMIIEGAKSGTPIPQLLKYIDVLQTHGGLTQAEDAELNR